MNAARECRRWGDQIEAQCLQIIACSSLNVTIVATAFLPLSFITGLLGMNVAGIPEQHSAYGLWLVTGLSVMMSVLPWLVLRRQTHGRYPNQASTGKKKPGRPAETTPPDNEGMGHKSGGIQLQSDRPFSRSRIGGIHGFAVLLALVLFYLHVVVIFDVIAEMLRFKPWMLEHLGPKHTGKVFLLGSFFALLLAHVAEAAVWGLFFRGTRLLPSITDGIYFTAASITTLGYGDILLKYPWRHLGTLIAITGVLMFGCSTAFLFVVLQDVWQHSLTG